MLRKRSIINLTCSKERGEELFVLHINSVAVCVSAGS